MTNIENLREVLLRGSLKYKFGVILAAEIDSWKLDILCMELNAALVDFHELFSRRIPDSSNVVPYDEKDLLQNLKEICQATTTQPIAMIINLDLALAKLSSDAISSFWYNFATLAPMSPTAVVVVIPTKSIEIHPVGQELDQWKRWGRLTVSDLL